MSGTTAAQPTINITDAYGAASDLLLIEGQTLEAYFASSTTLTAPIDDEMTLADGIPMQMGDVVPAGATLVVAKLPKNG